MGIFNFLKKKKEIQTIKFEEVELWMKNYLKEQLLDQKINNFNKRIELKIKDAKELLEKLNQATLMNEKIPERAKQIMDGQRKNYIQKTTFFLDSIIFPEDYIDIRDYSKKLTDDLDELSKDTQKSYFVLKEFVESDLMAVARKIKEIETQAINFRQDIEKENLHKLEKIKQKLKDYSNSKKTISELKKIKITQNESLEMLKEKKKKILEKIELLKKDSSFKEYSHLEEEHKNCDLEINDQKKSIQAHFSNLEKALKKYKHISLNEGIIDNYLKDASGALLKDDNFEIITVLEGMDKSLDKLELKDKKAEKTSQEINALNKEALSFMKNNLKKSFDKKDLLRKRLNANSSQLNLSEQESWLESTNYKIQEQKLALEDSENKIDRQNPDLIKSEIKNLLKDFDVMLDNG